MTDYTDHAARDELRQLADKATPGPWFSDQVSMGTWDVSRNFAPGRRHVESIVEALHEIDDAEFIAASREAVPALLNLIDQLNDRAKQAEAVVQSLTTELRELKTSLITDSLMAEARADD